MIGESMQKRIRFLSSTIILSLILGFAQEAKHTLIQVDNNLSINEVFQLALDNANSLLGKNFDTLIETSNRTSSDNNNFARAYSQKDDETKQFANGNSPESLTINVHKINDKLYYSWTVSQFASEYFLLTDLGRKLQISRKNLKFEPALVSNQQDSLTIDELNNKALENVKEKIGLDFSTANRSHSTLGDVVVKHFFIVNGKELTVILFNSNYSGQGYFWFTKQCLKGDMKFEHTDGQILEGVTSCH